MARSYLKKKTIHDIIGNYILFKINLRKKNIK